MKILFIIPYFGKLPQWFPMFLSSLEGINSADFLFLTDDYTSYSYPKNTKVEYTSFIELQNIFKSKVTCDIYLEHPYKLCDYRPLYGEIFQEHLTNYDYWGYCDLDMIFGDLDGFLEKHGFFKENFDRFSKAGHLTIYKNNKRLNSLYKTKLNKYDNFFGFNYGRSTTFPTHFDEVGMNILCYQSKLKFFDKTLYGNVAPETERISIQFYRKPEILYRYKGKLWVSYLNTDGTIDFIELMYLHIMRRPVIPILCRPESDYIITDSGFHPFKMDKILEYFEKYGKDNPLTQDIHLNQINISNKKKSKNMIVREIKEFPFNSIFSIFKRIISRRLIRKLKY